MPDRYNYIPAHQDVFTSRPDVFSSGILIGGSGLMDDRALSQLDLDSLMATATRGGPVQVQEAQDTWKTPDFAAQLQQYDKSLQPKSEEDTLMSNTTDTDGNNAKSSPDSPPVTTKVHSVSDNGDDEQPSFNDDDDPMSKRKAQNRAAQRAFRERRERRVKELQDKLAQSEKRIKEMEDENTRLQKDLEWHMAENKALKESSIELAFRLASSSEPGRGNPASTQVVFPAFLDEAAERRHKELVAGDKTGIMYYTPSQIWDILKEHPRTDAIDMENVIKRLMNKVQCSGNGPVFSSHDVDAAIKLALLDHDGK